jgi:hypothetical protein
MNSGIEYTHAGFVTVFWNELYSGNEKAMEGVYAAQELATLRQAGELPHPSSLDFVQALQWWSMSSHFGDMGVDCGFVPDRFLKEYVLGVC